MPNGHGGIPRYGSPVLISIILIIIWSVFGSQALWASIVSYFLLIMLSWRLAYHIHMWDAMEYDGGFTSGRDIKQDLNSTWEPLFTPSFPAALSPGLFHKQENERYDDRRRPPRTRCKLFHD